MTRLHLTQQAATNAWLQARGPRPWLSSPLLGVTRWGVQAQSSERGASSERECTAVPHCFSTGVNLLASLHWAAAAGLELCEYCMAPSPLMRHLVRRP